jgi:hypothetical protein
LAKRRHFQRAQGVPARAPGPWQEQEMPDIEQPKPSPRPDPNAGLVKMTKDNVEIFVHPSTVAAHAKQGWKRAA